MRRLLLILLVSLAAFAQINNPVADTAATVVVGNARFTLLTSQLVRLEWAADGHFEDHASMVFLNRHLPVPVFTKHKEGSTVILTTEHLILRYRPSANGFAADNLTITLNLNNKEIVWHPLMEDRGNLGGTRRTLDGADGPVPVEPGLISRDGWTLVDDSSRPLFDHVSDTVVDSANPDDTSTWPWVIPRPAGKRQDWYFFGYGHDYKQALTDFARVAGKIPMPPRFAFGTWWSRYWSYTDQEFQELVRGFRQNDVPLDVLVIDMDWHITFGTKWWENKKDQSDHKLGWTGYTWNSDLFPDPTDFLAWVHQQGLKTTLNMHPASGVQPHEAAYPEMARAMGIDPASKKYVPFDIASKKFTENYFKLLHRPLEKQGIDFFWLDWQQEDQTSLPGVNPTWWLNYVHTTDMEREGRRPLIFHRWGGLGNHRYQIGFSGDTIVSWKSLAFQPWFTATAANVGYAYWSHDIGGHMFGTPTPELYARWIQWGAFSPILRTHTTKNPEAERRIWAYPPHYETVMRDAFQLRYSLIPYIYTQSRQTYDSGVAFLRPLYYDYPDAPEAYDLKDEYIFGDDMIVAPVTSERDAVARLSTQSIWIPPGEWIEWFTGAHLRGPAKIERSFALNEIPVYVRAGAVVPMQPKMDYTGQRPVDPLIVTVFPGNNGDTRLYEDAGDSLGYKTKEFAWTSIKQERQGDSVAVEVSPVSGSYPNMPQDRAYEFRLFGVFPPKRVTVNGEELAFTRDESKPGWHYDGNKTTVVVRTRLFSVNDRVQLTAELPHATDAQLNTLALLPGRISRLYSSMEVLNGTWTKGWSPDSLIRAYQTGDRLTYYPQTALKEADMFPSLWQQTINDMLAMQKEGIDRTAILTALGHLGVTVELKAIAQ